MEQKEFNPIELEKRDMQKIEEVRKIYIDYGLQIRQAIEEGNVNYLYKLAENKEYKVRWVDNNYKFRDPDGSMQLVTRSNSVRIGEGRELLVGVIDGQVDILDLAHDVGAVLLGTKEKGYNSDPIRVENFNKVTKFSIGKVYTPPEMEKMGLIEKNEKTGNFSTVIHQTHLLDSLISKHDNLEYKAIKYVPINH